MQWTEFSFRIRHLTAADQKKVQIAFETGNEAHEGQKRQSGEPYFTHPIAVAHILVDMGADADTIAAALLHDTVEDTNLTLQDVSKKINPTVAMLVDGVTKLSEQDMAEYPNLNQQIETLRKMFTLMQKDPRIMVIKLADRLHNMQTISFQKPHKQKAIAKETLDVYVKIADRLCMRDTRDVLEDLSRAVLEPEVHAAVTELRKRNDQRSSTEIAYITAHLKKNSRSLPFIEIQHERKTWEKNRLQYELEGMSLTGVSGLNMIFICKTVNDCYLTLGLLHQLWHREILTFEDFINAPVINGYKGLHTTILLENGMRIRCKIRTTEMNEYAHKGITLFCFEKKNNGLIEQLPWVSHISSVAQDTSRRSEKFWDSLQTDILGESIVVHGPSDESALIPRGATVLDAAFYLLGNDALRAESLFMSGKPVSFFDEAQNASTITAKLSPEKTVELTWLQQVHTGIASAMIRQALVNMPKQDRESIGHEMLDSAFRRIARTSIDELAPSVLKTQLHSLHISTVSDLYTKIAEGSLNPDHIVRSVFRTKEDNLASSEWILRVDIPAPPDVRTERAIRMFAFKKVQYNVHGDRAHIKAFYTLTTKQVYDLQNALSAVLHPKDWSLVQSISQQRLMIAMFTLVVLWGLDPVFAHRLLDSSVTPVTLTIIRFIVFFFASSAAYFTQTFVIKQKLKPLFPLQVPLLLSGGALFITGLFTYITLSLVPATQYIVYVVAGLVLANTIKSYLTRKEWLPQFLGFILLVGGISTMTYVRNVSYLGVLAAIASSFGFALYSEVSRRYQREVTTIQARYPAFMFWVSAVCLLLSAATLPFVEFTIPSSWILFQTTAFAIVFAVVPYVLFFETTRRTTSKFLDNALPFVFVSTIIGELLLTKDITSLIPAPLLLIFLWLYVNRERNERM